MKIKVIWAEIIEYHEIIEVKREDEAFKDMGLLEAGKKEVGIEKYVNMRTERVTK